MLTGLFERAVDIALAVLLGHEDGDIVQRILRNSTALRIIQEFPDGWNHRFKMQSLVNACQMPRCNECSRSDLYS